MNLLTFFMYHWPKPFFLLWRDPLVWAFVFFRVSKSKDFIKPEETGLQAEIKKANTTTAPITTLQRRGGRCLEE